MKKGLFSLLMTCCLVFSMLPVSAQAAYEVDEYGTYTVHNTSDLAAALTDLGDTEEWTDIQYIPNDGQSPLTIDRNISIPERVQLVLGDYDLVIASGATLTNDGSINAENVTVNSGGTLIIDEGYIGISYTLTVNGKLTNMDDGYMIVDFGGVEVGSKGTMVNYGILNMLSHDETGITPYNTVTVASGGKFDSTCGIIFWIYSILDVDDFAPALEDIAQRRLDHPTWLQNACFRCTGEVTISKNVTLPQHVELEILHPFTISKNCTLTTNANCTLEASATIRGTWINNDHIWMPSINGDSFLTLASGGSYSGGSIQVDTPYWNEYDNLPWDIMPGFSQSMFIDMEFWGDTYYLLGEQSSGLRLNSNPKDVTAAVGSTATFTVVPAETTAHLKYQWQFSADGGKTWGSATATGCRTATLSVPVTAARNGYQYRCMISDGTTTVRSKTVTLTVSGSVAKPTITTQPASATATPDGTAKFTVSASGTALKYQWQFRTSASGTWSNATASGNQTATLNLGTVGTARDGYQYRCKITNSAGTVYSDVVTLYIKPKITTQPTSVTANAGATATFTVKASGTGLSYQWQFKAPGYGWQNNTCKTATFSVSATATRNGYQYRCLVTGKSGKIVTSSAATLTVNAAAKPTITTQPKNVSTTVGSTAKFTVAASGTDLSYQWQFKAPGYGWQSNTCKTATFSVPATAGRNGYQYRCIVKNAGGSVTSNAVTLTVTAGKPSITTQPKDVSVTADGAAKFTVAASGTGLKYQWQYKAPGYSWKNNTCTKATLTISPAEDWRDGYQYRCIVKNDNGSVTSGAAELSIKPKITAQPDDVTTAASGTAKFTVKATGADLSYQWQYKAPGYGWKDNSCTSATLTISPAASWRDGYQYRCIVSSENGLKATSEAALLSVE